MRRECRERFPWDRLQRNPLVNDPDMHHGTCETHVPWSMSGSQTRGGGENVPGFPGGCATSNLTHLVRGPWSFDDGSDVKHRPPINQISTLTRFSSYARCLDNVYNKWIHKTTELFSYCRWNTAYVHRSEGAAFLSWTFVSCYSIVMKFGKK